MKILGISNRTKFELLTATAQDLCVLLIFRQFVALAHQLRQLCRIKHKVFSLTKIKSLNSFVEFVSQQFKRAGKNQLLFRGHKNRDYVAQPSVSRETNWVNSEHEMIRRLLAEHPTEFSDDRTTFETLVRAQHYGLPTRLLDVTKNPLVALYFATEFARDKKRNVNKSGEVIVFSPAPEKRKFFDSDTLSCLSNLSLLKHEQKELIRRHALKCREEVSADYEDDATRFREELTRRFNDHEAVKRLVELVNFERPGFVARIHPYDLLNVTFVTPRKLHARLAAQDGAFLVYGLLWNLKEYTFVDDVEIQEVYIPHANKAQIRADLAKVGISNETLFPEIDKSAAQIARSYLD